MEPLKSLNDRLLTCVHFATSIHSSVGRRGNPHNSLMKDLQQISKAWLCNSEKVEFPHCSLFTAEAICSSSRVQQLMNLRANRKHLLRKSTFRKGTTHYDTLEVWVRIQSSINSYNNSHVRSGFELVTASNKISYKLENIACYKHYLQVSLPLQTVTHCHNSQSLGHSLYSTSLWLYYCPSLQF